MGILLGKEDPGSVAPGSFCAFRRPLLREEPATGQRRTKQCRHFPRAPGPGGTPQRGARRELDVMGKRKRNVQNRDRSKAHHPTPPHALPAKGAGRA
ncbi:hypothetical protein GCM10009863_42060 [Streptomyces axinellae]|uniref:Uncharacterized protein n=1 Tax=Streptomyces axinellae TaxID=552788 RepID=A0ABP6CSY6_9ACTN